MGWNYMATFNGNWSIPYLPGAALDAAGNLWVMWGDSSTSALTYFTQALGESGQPVKVSPTPTNQATRRSPALVPADGKLVALWRGVGDDQAIRISLVSPGLTPFTPQTIGGANTVDGPTAAYLANADVVFPVWRGSYPSTGTSDTTFWYSNVSNPGSGQFGTATTQSFNNGKFNSYYSPAVVAMPGGGVGVCWKGVGAPGTGVDDQLYFSAAQSNSSPQWTPGDAVPVTYQVSGSTTKATALNRPSLALLSTSQTETLILAYTSSPPGAASGGARQLSYLLGTLNGGAVTWTAPSSADGAVPLGTVLAAAGGGSMTNPVAVWVAAAGTGSPLYLLVGDQAGGTITGPLYLLAYSGE
jgi:hypothetical protein